MRVTVNWSGVINLAAAFGSTCCVGYYTDSVALGFAVFLGLFAIMPYPPSK